MPLVARVPLALAGTAGAASCVAYSTSRKVAFRVDQKGVTLGGGPLRYEAQTSFFPWDGVRAVVLWRRAAPSPWPALRWPALRPAGAGLVGTAGLAQRWPRCARRHLAHVGVVVSVERHTELPRPAPEDLKAGATRGMQAFRVDSARLAAAIATFAPAVQLISSPS